MALFLFVFTYAVHTEFYTLSLHDALPIWVKVVKNKVAPPFKQAEFDIMYAEGISHTSLLVDIGAEANIIEKSGAWYSYNGQKIGQGRENAKLYLKDNPQMLTEIEEKVKVILGMAPVKPGAEELAVEDE